MKKIVLAVLMLATGIVSAADAAAIKSKCAVKLERLAEKMFPQQALNEALGFFGPVTKKYLPVFNRFNAEYQAEADKIAVVRKYLPKADAALAEAKAMKIPAKYEPKKAEYLRTAQTFLTLAKLTVSVLNDGVNRNKQIK